MLMYNEVMTMSMFVALVNALKVFYRYTRDGRMCLSRSFAQVLGKVGQVIPNLSLASFNRGQCRRFSSCFGSLRAMGVRLRFIRWQCARRLARRWRRDISRERTRRAHRQAQDQILTKSSSLNPSKYRIPDVQIFES